MKIKIEDSFINEDINDLEFEYVKKDIIKENYVEKGIIEVVCKLGSKDGLSLKGAKINLYLLEGVSPKLKCSKYTDVNGNVIFDNLENGCYRVISIVDRNYFEKPVYQTWNEYNVDKENKYASITIINKIKNNKKK